LITNNKDFYFLQNRKSNLTVVFREHDLSAQPMILGETSNKLPTSLSNTNVASKIKPEPVEDKKKITPVVAAAFEKPKEEKHVQPQKQKENVKATGKQKIIILGQNLG
jgi:hypothetical protein